MKVNISNALSERNRERRGSALVEGSFTIQSLDCEAYDAIINGIKKQCTRWVLICLPYEDGKKNNDNVPQVRIVVTPYRNTLYTSDTGGKGGTPQVFTPAGDFGAELHQLFSGRTPAEVARDGERLIRGNPRISVGIATFYDFVGEYPRQVQTLQRI